MRTPPTPWRCVAVAALAACGKTSSSPPASSTQAVSAAPSATVPESPTSATRAETPAPAPCVASPAVADVHVDTSVGGGFGAELERLFIDGTRALLIVRDASVEGAAVGAFEACLRDEDVRAFEPLARAAAASSEPLQRDSGVFSFRLSTRGGKIEVKAPVPPSSPAASALVREVNRWLVLARAKPVQAIRLELSPPSESPVVGRPATYKLRVVNVGAAALTVSYPDEGPWLEATDAPPEPPAWEPVTEKTRGLARNTLAPGASFETPMIVTHAAATKLAVWARFEGRLELGGAPHMHMDEPFFARVISKPLVVDVRAR